MTAMPWTVALLFEGPLELGVQAGLLRELAALGEPGEVILAAPEIMPGPVGGSARLVASLHPRAGLLGALQSALLAASFSTILALDARQPLPRAPLLRALLADPRPAHALAHRDDRRGPARA